MGTGSQNGWLRNRWLRKFGVFIVKCRITKDLNVPDCNCARVRLESQRILSSHFVIPLYVNVKLVDGYRASALIYKRVKIQGIQGGFCEILLAKIHVKSPSFGTNENVEITVGV